MSACDVNVMCAFQLGSSLVLMCAVCVLHWSVFFSLLAGDALAVPAFLSPHLRTNSIVPALPQPVPRSRSHAAIPQRERSTSAPNVCINLVNGQDSSFEVRATLASKGVRCGFILALFPVLMFVFISAHLHNNAIHLGSMVMIHSSVPPQCCP